MSVLRTVCAKVLMVSIFCFSYSIMCPILYEAIQSKIATCSFQTVQAKYFSKS